eukprot:155566-Rhodomonas_salina.1
MLSFLDLLAYNVFPDILHTYILDGIHLNRTRMVSRSIRKAVDDDPLISSFLRSVAHNKIIWFTQLYSIDNARLNALPPQQNPIIHHGNREYFLDWTLDVIREFQIPPATMHAAIAVIDRYPHTVLPRNLQLLAASGLKHATDLQIDEYWYDLGESENITIDTEFSRWTCDYAFPSELHVEMEHAVESECNWDTFGTFSGQWIWRIREVLQDNAFQIPMEVTYFAAYLTDLLYISTVYDTHSPAAIALASFALGLGVRSIPVPFTFLCWLVRVNARDVMTIMNTMRTLHQQDWQSTDKVITLSDASEKTINRVRTRYQCMERMFVGSLPLYATTPEDMVMTTI